MEPKKNKILSRLRAKAKPIFNVKIGKRGKKTPLTYRRSVSVPDLRCTESAPSVLDSVAQSPGPDCHSYSGVKSHFYLGEAESDTSSLAHSDSFTDAQFPDKCTNQLPVPLDMHPAPETAPPSGLACLSFPVPCTPFLTQDMDRFSLPETLSLSALPDLGVLPASEKPTCVDVPLEKDTSDNKLVMLPDTLSPSPFTEVDVLSALEKPTTTEVPVGKAKSDSKMVSSTALPELDNPSVTEKPLLLEVPIRKDRRMEERDRTTTWYIDESPCSTPSEERSCSPCAPELELTTGPEPSSPIPMCIAGSAENLIDVVNESNDYDIRPSGRDRLPSAVGSESQAAPAGVRVQYLLTIHLQEGRNLVIRDRSGRVCGLTAKSCGYVALGLAHRALVFGAVGMLAQATNTMASYPSEQCKTQPNWPSGNQSSGQTGATGRGASCGAVNTAGGGSFTKSLPLEECLLPSLAQMD